MTDINKQKFLAELGKLLTFMYEEDRLDALYMYEEMFNSCSDEQQLIHHLVSPTRQAVVLARAYNAKERMLSVQSQSKRGELYDEGEDIVPAFISAIENIRYEAAGLFEDKPQPAFDEDQFSLFGEDEPAPEEPAVVEETVSEVPAEESEEAVQEVLSEDEPVYYDEAPAIEIVEDDGEELRFSAPSRKSPAAEDEQEIYNTYTPRPRRRKRIVALLILYIIFAVPIGLVGVTLLMVPTVLCLCLCIIFAAAGLAAVSCAFGSFAIFADILVVMGSGLILLALGLLFLWLFVWFIGGAIAGFVNAVIKLGDRFSSREVTAE